MQVIGLGMVSQVLFLAPPNGAQSSRRVCAPSNPHMWCACVCVRAVSATVFLRLLRLRVPSFQRLGLFTDLRHPNWGATGPKCEFHLGAPLAVTGAVGPRRYLFVTQNLRASLTSKRERGTSN